MGNKLDGNDLNRFLATAGGPTPKTGNDLEGNPLLPSPGETIDSPWGQATVERLIPRYSTAAVRDATILDPEEGQVCYVAEADQIQIWGGTEWVEIPDRAVTDAAYLGNFVALTRGATLDPVTVTSTNEWTPLFPQLNMGSPGVGVWVSATFTGSILIPGGADGVSRARVEISTDGTATWEPGPGSWVTVDGTNRRQTFAAQHWVGMDPSDVPGNVWVQASVLRSNGGDPTFDDMTLTAVIAKTSGKT